MLQNNIWVYVDAYVILPPCHCDGVTFSSLDEYMHVFFTHVDICIRKHSLIKKVNNDMDDPKIRLNGQDSDREPTNTFRQWNLGAKIHKFPTSHE